MSRLDRLVDELLDELRSFEPGVLSGEGCARLVPRLATAEKAMAAARARAAVRAAECGAHREAGFADASDWLARATGTSARGARTEMETTRALESCPETAEALAVGAVSFAQATEIVKTVAEVPGAETAMLAFAKTAGLSRLHDEGRKHRSRAVPAEELYAKQRAAREVRHWRDELGMVCGRFRLTPDVGVAFVNRLDREADRVRRRAKRDGRAEGFEAHAADAFVALVAEPAETGTRGTGTKTKTQSKSKSKSVDLVLVCDVNPYRRGHAHPGEVCHIVGGGPIPVAVARELSRDAFMKAVLHDGVNIHTVAHFGRHVPAHLRTALDLGPLPELDGVTCTEEGCDRRYGLERDHVDPVANHGLTSYANLAPRCKVHHWEKTERDRQAGLLSSNRGRAGARPPPS